MFTNVSTAYFIRYRWLRAMIFFQPFVIIFSQIRYFVGQNNDKTTTRDMKKWDKIVSVEDDLREKRKDRIKFWLWYAGMGLLAALSATSRNST